MIRNSALQISALLLLSQALVAIANDRPPIIDMHVHAISADMDGPGSTGFCAPYLEHLPPYDGQLTPAESWMGFFEEPPCQKPFWSPTSDEDLRKESLRVMAEHNVIGVVGGSFDRVNDWHAHSPERVIKGVDFVGPEGLLEINAFRQRFEAEGFQALAEIAPQYLGLSPLDPSLAPYWRMAEELQVPIGFHMVDGIPAINTTIAPDHRIAAGHPLLLEELLVRHPNLRLYVMHYGSPFVEEMIAIMNVFPQVYVELGGIQWVYPRKYFYRQLEAFVDAGFGKRIMFGSDQMVWPELISYSINVVEEAPFLSNEQKRDIFYNNAARFLRLTEDQVRRHHEMGSAD